MPVTIGRAGSLSSRCGPHRVINRPSAEGFSRHNEEYTMDHVRSTLRLLVIVLVSAALAACATGADQHGYDHGDNREHERYDDDHHNEADHNEAAHNNDDHDDQAPHDGTPHQHEGAGGRLLVATSRGTIAVLDAHDGDVEAIFARALSGGSLAAHAGPSGEFGYVVHRDASIVVVVDSGQILEEHDGHEDLELGPISILGQVRAGKRPSHFTTMAGRVGFYNEESGDVTILEEARLRSGASYRLIPALVGRGAPVLLSDRLIIGYADESFAEVIGYDGYVQQSIPDVRGAQGAARVGRFSAIGTVDGVLIVTQTGDRFDAETVPNPPGTPNGARTGTIAAHPRLPHFVGDLGQGLVTVDPQTLTSVAHQLPAAPWHFGIDRSGHYVVVLGQDGLVYVLDSESFEILGSVEAVSARDTDAARGTPAPALTLGRRVAYVSDPSANRILEIHLDEVEIEGEFRLDLDGTVTSIALMVTDGVVH